MQKNRFHKRRRLLSEENAKKNYETKKSGLAKCEKISQ